MKKKAYIYTNKENPTGGIMAAILGLLSLVTLGLIIRYSFIQEGLIPARQAGAMLLAGLFSLVGLTLAILALAAKDKYRRFPIIGLALNGLALAAVALLFFWGVTA